MRIILETNRLILRELSPDDAVGMFELDSDPKVHQYLGNKPISEIAQAEKTIEIVRKQYAEYGIGRWAVIEKESQQFIGWSGLKFMKESTNGHTNYYDLGYRLISKYWGKGYATETAIATLNYGFNFLNLNEIYATAAIENKASNKILNKIGFNQIGTFYYEDILCNFYKIISAKQEI